jgi:DNA-directed RNA polymerase specialized sigma24 family protein
VEARQLSLEERLTRAAHGAPAFATLSADQRRAVVRAYLARRQAGGARQELERLLDHNPEHVRDVFELHRRQSTFEEEVAAWPQERER